MIGARQNESQIAHKGGDMGAASALAPYEVSAYNTAATSENRIHDDSVAQRFGFVGALVPGVEVYAYMAHMPVARWGRAWLEHGGAEARFLKPVYDGAIARVSARADGDALALDVRSRGAHCATGRAFAPAPAAPFEISGAPAPTATRPPASEHSLAPGLKLGVRPVAFDRAALAAYLEDIRETQTIYLAEGLVHPGQILRLANQALVQNVVLGPWIHVGSSVRNHSLARLGERLTLDARIVSNAVSKGHAIVDFDAVAHADGRAVASIRHTAIWRPRQVASAQ